jgi:hypothetical protein
VGCAEEKRKGDFVVNVDSPGIINRNYPSINGIDILNVMKGR